MEPFTGEPFFQAIEIVRGDGLNVGREDRRARALILPPLPRDPVRRRNGNLRPGLPNTGFKKLLVGRVRVSMQQTYRNRFDTFLPECFENPGELVDSERCVYVSGMGDPLGDFLP